MLQLRPYQTEAIASTFRALTTHDNALFVLPTGGGKAQPLTAKVLTPSGWARMGNLAVGDHVIGRNGKHCRVTGIYPQGTKPVYRVTFSDGTATECCADHLWAVQTKWQKHDGQGFAVKPLRALMADLRDGSGARKWFVPLVEPVQFAEREVPLDPYLLGVLLGDGNWTNGWVRFSTPEAFVVREVAARVPEPVTVRHVDAYDYGLQLPRPVGRAGGPVGNALRALGLWGTYSHEKFVPECYKINSVAVRLAVLRGLLDTDGHIRPASGTTTFSSTSRQLAEDVCEIARSLGGTTRVRYKKPARYTHNGEKRIGRESYRVTVSLDGINPFLLPRKANLVQHGRKQGQTKAIDAVEYVGEMPCQCIAVDAPDHLYVTDDYIVTHNTEVFVAMLDQLLRSARHGDKRYLVLADRDHLVNNPHERFLRRFPQHAHRAGIVKAHERDYGAQVVFASVQTLVTGDHLTNLLAHGPISFVVTDEAHRAVTAQHAAILEALRSAYPTLKHVGCTATPVRADGTPLKEAFDVVSMKRDIGWGIGAGYLVPAKWLAIRTGISFAGLRTSRTTGDYSQRQLAKVLDTDNYRELIVATHKKYAAGRQGITFVPQVEVAHKLAADFTAAGIPAAAADGTTPKPERAAILARFQRGELAMLCCYPGLWGEGLDLPELSVVHMACPTKSTGRYLQCVGRGLRPAPWVQKEDCLILDYAPIENRKILMLGDVLLGDKARRVVEEALEAAAEEDEEEAITGFLFDGEFKGLTGDPLALVAEQLHYLDASPYAGSRLEAWLVMGLGRDAAGVNRTLAITPPDDTGQCALYGLYFGTSTRPDITLLGSGDFAAMTEQASEYAAQHANPALAHKTSGWRDGGASRKQYTYLRQFASKAEVEAWARKRTTTMTKGEIATAITVFQARAALRAAGLWGDNAPARAA